MAAKQLEEQWKQEYGTDEPKLQVTLQNAGIKKKSVICSADAKALIFYLNTCQNGVYEYSRSLEGMVETSSNTQEF